MGGNHGGDQIRNLLVVVAARWGLPGGSGWADVPAFSVESPVPRSKRGDMRETSGFRVGMQAHMMPTLTSIADHMNDSEAYPRNS